MHRSPQKKRWGELKPVNFDPALTEQERTDCLRLRARWDEEQKKRKAANAEPIYLYVLSVSAGKSESAASHYIQGRYPLNIEWKMRFAQLLKLEPQAIWPEWEFRDLTHISVYTAVTVHLSLPSPLAPPSSEKKNLKLATHKKKAGRR